jgi:hypothetical protein
MDVKTFHAVALETDIAELVPSLGGWPAIMQEWKSLGGYDAQYADVWEISSLLFQEEELFAERLNVDVMVIRGFASAVQTHAVLDRLDAAQDLLGEFCNDMASQFEAWIELNKNDLEGIEFARLWRSYATAFQTRTSRVPASPFG